MEAQDLQLIERHISSDNALKSLYNEHVDFERQLEKLNNKPFLTPQEEMERKLLQKKKLHGRDMIEEILKEYRGK